LYTVYTHTNVVGSGWGAFEAVPKGVALEAVGLAFEDNGTVSVVECSLGVEENAEGLGQKVEMVAFEALSGGGAGFAVGRALFALVVFEKISGLAS
jgi:hypothetical protein